MQKDPQQTTAILDLSRIPTLPQTLIDLIDACNDRDVDLQTVGDIVCRDAAISARILQLANSAFLGSRTAFGDTEQAVIYLGIDTVRNLAISVSVHETFRAFSDPAGTSLARFWHHSLLTAVLARSLAMLTDYPRPAEAYLAGLLHDLGKLLLEQAYPQEYHTMAEDAAMDPARLEEMEKRCFGITHSAVGSLLVGRWNLQAPIAEAIEMHHHDDQLENQHGALVTILHLANLLSQSSLPRSRHIQDLIDRMGISPQSLSACLASAEETVSTIAESMGIMIQKPDFPQPEKAKTDNGRQELAEKVGRLSRLHGALDNLVRAETRDRTLRVIEESLHILFAIDRCLVFLPEPDTSRFATCCSEINPLSLLRRGLTLSRQDGGDILAMCPESKSGVCLLTRQGDSSEDSAERRLFRLFASPFLLAVALPAGSWHGFLVAAIATEQACHLPGRIEDLSCLARHAAARLYLDILSRKTAEDLARERVEAVQQVARTIAHEINNPLAIVQNYLSILDMRLSDRPEIQEELTAVNEEITRIGSIIAQLDDLSNPPVSRGTQVIDLNSLLRESLALFQQTIFLQFNISSQLELDPRLPPIQSNPGFLRQILANLLKNAAEALSAGGTVWLRSVYLRHCSQTGSDSIRITIEDNGPGISSHLEEKLFSAGVTDKTAGHLGIGLAIVKKLVTELGGTISCCHRPGGGACFTIDLLIKN